MSDSTVRYNEPSSGDRLMDVDQRSVGGKTVTVVKNIVVDGVNNYKAAINALGQLSVRAEKGKTLNNGNVQLATQGQVYEIVPQLATRRALWIINYGSTWHTIGSNNATGSNLGIPIYPGERINITEAPAAAWYAYARSAGDYIAFVEERD